jgi:hypothetical protein
MSPPGNKGIKLEEQVAPNGLLQPDPQSRGILIGALGIFPRADLKNDLPSERVKKHLVSQRKTCGVLRLAA